MKKKKSSSKKKKNTKSKPKSYKVRGYFRRSPIPKSRFQWVRTHRRGKRSKQK